MPRLCSAPDNRPDVNARYYNMGNQSWIIRMVRKHKHDIVHYSSATVQLPRTIIIIITSSKKNLYKK